MREKREIRLKKCCRKEPLVALKDYFTIEIKCPKCGRKAVTLSSDPREAVRLWNKELEDEKCQENIAS